MSLRLQRHDRAWLAAGFDPEGSVCDATATEAVRAWLAAGRPLVVASQHGLDERQVRLGLTLPGSARRRVGLVVARGALQRVAPALALREAIASAPAGWRPVIGEVERLCRHSGVMARVFGSLAAQVASGERYLDADSDLDLLFECRAGSDLDELLGGLRALDDARPRLDGEIRLPCDWDVAWRELARVRQAGAPAGVLARSARERRIVPLARLLPSALAA